MPSVLNWRSAPRLPSPVGRIVNVLRRGAAVVIPADTEYTIVVNARDEAAVPRLAELAGGLHESAIVLAAPGAVRDWVSELSPLGQRLTRRCWPGPVRFYWPNPGPDGLATRLPTSARPANGLALWAPRHDAMRAVLARAEFPLLAAGLAVASPAEAVRRLGDGVELVLDAGPVRLAQPATLVEVDGPDWRVLREGAISAAELGRQSACLVVFVCTGNTCRSPLAEALCKQSLAEKLGCGVEDLPARGYWVLSAGMAAMRGEPAASEALAVAAEFGADLSHHASRPISPDLLAQADYLIAMTRAHQQALAAASADRAVVPRLLCGPDDLADPIGGDADTYRVCARAIRAHLDGLLAELVPT